MKQISIVTPIFCEQDNIQRYYDVVTAVISTLPDYDWTLLFVDDGSSDQSVAMVRALIEQDDRVGLLGFSRNFGKEAALTAGVVESLHADAIITIDADLQHPPEIIPDMVKLWEDGYPVVATIRKSVESHSMLRQLGSSLYYSIMEKVGGHHVIRKSTDFRLIDRRVAEEFARLSERIHMYRGSIDWLGFKTAHYDFDAGERFAGEARYSYAKLFSLAINSITSFSLWPLKITGYLGIMIAFVSMALLLVCIGLNLYNGIWFISPIALFVVFNTFLVGLLMICLGLIALYIGNINNEVIRRPNYVIANRNGKNLN